ncbi:MAG: isoleucine--tRNA ligase [FCB group bacterium]|nr:isoleucine--tRNA ligase [FCB group bacterium]
MAIKKVNPKVDFIALEHRVLDFWAKNRIFEKRVQLNKGKPKWSFIDGPITANNPMGVHHAWGRTLKDLYQRYKAMTGHELRYQNGFDCQGLWVEVEVEKELGFKSKRDIEEFGVEKFIDLCRKRVIKYSGVQTEQSIRLGYWMDWDNSYYTMSDENNYTIWMFLNKLYQRGKIYRGTDVVPWSGRSGTSYSQMEIIEGRKLVAHDALFVRFPLKQRENEYLLVWTTTPWTLTSNVAAAVNRNLEYVKLRAADGALYYFAADNLEYQRLEKQFKEQKQWVKGVPKLKTIAQIFKERGGYTIEGSVMGEDMIGWEYEGPFDYLEAQSVAGGYPFVKKDLQEQGIRGVDCHKVIDGGKDKEGNDVVVGGEGTGIVHIAPGCGDIDHQIGKKLGLVDIAPLDEEARFIEGFGWLKGMSATAEETKQKIIADLKERGFLIQVEKYPHIYPHCWRSGEELVFRIVEEWYIRMDWRDQIKAIVDQIKWIPEWGRDREHEWLDNMGDWMISKKRFWGLALPIWTFEDGSFYVVSSKEELQKLAVEGWEEFEGHTPHRPWIDKVKIRHPQSGLIGSRIPDVGNPWLDAGIVPYSTLKYTSDREYWRQWFPADFVTESFPGQFRNWFYSLLAMSTVMENEPPFKTLLGHAMVKDETGRDMHKSWGNAIWFDDAAEKMGVDVMRWIYGAQNVEHNLLFGYGTANDVRKKLITLWNTYSFFATYAAVDGFDPTKASVSDDDLTVLDRWIRSKLHLLIQDAHKAFNEYQVDKFMRKVERFLEDLSNWYIRRNRRRFWKSEDDMDKQTAYHTLYDVLLTTSKLLAPIIPFVTEEIYQNLAVGVDKTAPESVHLCDYPVANSDYIDEQLMQRVDALKKLVELGRSARNKANIKIRQPLAKLCFVVEDDHLADFILEQQSVVLDELNVKYIERFDNIEELIIYRIRPNLAVIGKTYGKALPVIQKALSEQSAMEVVNQLQKQGEIALDTPSGKFNLTSDDIIVEVESAEGFTSATSEGLTVGLATKLDESLIKEGIVRDIIRQVQIMRKNAGFAVEDRIIVYGSFDGQIGEAMKEFQEYFCNETLTVSMESQFKPGEYQSTFKVREETITLGIQRATKA